MFRHDHKSFHSIIHLIATTTPHECYKITLSQEKIDVGEINELPQGYKAGEYQSGSECQSVWLSTAETSATLPRCLLTPGSGKSWASLKVNNSHSHDSAHSALPVRATLRHHLNFLCLGFPIETGWKWSKMKRGAKIFFSFDMLEKGPFIKYQHMCIPTLGRSSCVGFYITGCYRWNRELRISVR